MRTENGTKKVKKSILIPFFTHPKKNLRDFRTENGTKKVKKAFLFHFLLIPRRIYEIKQKITTVNSAKHIQQTSINKICRTERKETNHGKHKFK